MQLGKTVEEANDRKLTGRKDYVGKTDISVRLCTILKELILRKGKTLYRASATLSLHPFERMNTIKNNTGIP